MKKGDPRLFDPEDLPGTLGKSIMNHIRKITEDSKSDPFKMVELITAPNYSVGQACDIIEMMGDGVERTIIIWILVNMAEKNDNCFVQYVVQAIRKRIFFTKEIKSILFRLNTFA